jgi:Na+-translocating ferredoxin:NAD+ oxidoreductase RnfC subunit
MKEMKRVIDCPECGKECPRTLDGQDFSFTMPGATPKFYKSEENKKKMDNRWLNDEIENTKSAVKGETGVSPYSRMSINYEELGRQGVCKKNTTEQSKQKKESAGKAVRAAEKTMSETEKAQTTRKDRAHSK